MQYWHALRLFMHIQLFKEKEPLKTSRYFTIAFAEANIAGKAEEIVVKRAAQDSKKAKLMWRQERDILYSLHSSGIVKLLGSNLERKELYLEKINGEDIFNYCTNHTLSNFQSIKLMNDLTSTLSYLHSNKNDKPPIIQGDISPANILIHSTTDFLNPFFIDFQYSFFEGRMPNYMQSMTFGTPRFIPLECLDYDGINTTKRDIYSLGMVFYITLSNGFPYNFNRFDSIPDGMKFNWVKGIIGRNDPKPISTWDKKIDEIVMSMIEKNYKDRCTAREAYSAFNSLM